MLDMTAEEPWVPLYARMSEVAASDFARLHPGVPEWMRESLWEWLRRQLCTYVYRGGRQGYWDPNTLRIRETERICRIEVGWDGAGGDFTDRCAGLEALRSVLYTDDVKFLSAVDFYLGKVDDPEDAGKLQVILNESASAWRVGQLGSRLALVERIDETVQRAAEETAKQGTRAGQLLSDAWYQAFSMHRDPSAAYRCAVRAVEAAAGPILTPKDPRPSLGKMIPALRDGMQKWNFSFTVDSGVDPKSVLVQMMQLIWTNEYSRHVDVDPAVPLHVSQEEAESAVVLALTLVNWFTSGAISRVP
jgi:hypothetical protein